MMIWYDDDDRKINQILNCDFSVPFHARWLDSIYIYIYIWRVILWDARLNKNKGESWDLNQWPHENGEYAFQTGVLTSAKSSSVLFCETIRSKRKNLTTSAKLKAWPWGIGISQLEQFCYVDEPHACAAGALAIGALDDPWPCEMDLPRGVEPVEFLR